MTILNDFLLLTCTCSATCAATKLMHTNNHNQSSFLWVRTPAIHRLITKTVVFFLRFRQCLKSPSQVTCACAKFHGMFYLHSASQCFPRCSQCIINKNRPCQAMSVLTLAVLYDSWKACTPELPLTTLAACTLVCPIFSAPRSTAE